MGKIAFVIIITAIALLVIARVVRRIRLKKKRRDDPYRKVLFLDFDGVLHRGFREDFEHREDFEKVLKTHPDASVVISSDWRRGRTLEELRTIFSPSVREQFVGVTPELSLDDRQLEIEAFCEEHNVKSYLIIDDSEVLFRRGNPNTYFTDHKTGLNKDDLQYINEWLRKAS